MRQEQPLIEADKLSYHCPGRDVPRACRLMGRYSALIGKRVEVQYRAGDLHLLASGILASETAKAVFVEERFSRNGKEKIIRIEIPHEYLLRLRECPPEREINVAARSAVAPKQIPFQQPEFPK